VTEVEKKLPVTINLSAYHGDTLRQPFRFLKSGDPIDLNSSTVEASARERWGSSVFPLVVTIEPDPGLLTLSLPSDIHPGTFAYDLQITEENGDVTTWIKGDLIIAKDVTSVD
jgi:hypothetical protein